MAPPLEGRWGGRQLGPRPGRPPTWLSFPTRMGEPGNSPWGLLCHFHFSNPDKALGHHPGSPWGEGRPIYLINTSPGLWNLPSSHRGAQGGAFVTLITLGLLQHKALRNSFSTLINKSIKKMFDIISPEKGRKKKPALETPIISCCLVSDDR